MNSPNNEQWVQRYRLIEAQDRIAELEQALRESTEELRCVLMSATNIARQDIVKRVVVNERLLGGG